MLDFFNVISVILLHIDSMKIHACKSCIFYTFIYIDMVINACYNGLND